MTRAALAALSPNEQRILLLTSPCHFLTHMFILVFPAVTMPIVDSLGMPLEDVVKLSFLMYLFYGFGALPVGYLADRWQARKLMIGGVFLMGGGLLLAGLFPSPVTISTSLLLVGIGGSVYHPAGLALISRTVVRRGYALGVNGVFGNLGIAAAPLVTGVLTWLYSWQTAFVVMGGFAVVMGVLLSLIRIDETPHTLEREKKSGQSDYIRFFLIVCVTLVLGGLAYRGNTVLLPAYLEINTTFFKDFIESFSFMRTQGTATLAATVLTSVVMVAGIIGQLIGGRMADRFDLRWAYLVVHGLAFPFLLGMAFATNYALAFCAAMYALFSLGMQPIENSLIAALTPTRWRSVGFAVKFVLNFGVGSTVIYLIAPIKSTYDLQGVYIFLAGIALLLVLSIIALIVASRGHANIRN